MSKYFGIDLGTTYSCIATVDETGKPIVLANSEGELITPSVISLTDDGKYCVGAVAKDDITAEGVLVEEIKRRMSDIGYTIEVGKTQYNPVELSALILKKLKDDVEATGEVIDGVTITCPAYFGQIERKNTEDAGIAAGLNVLSVINEPTAAAYSYVDSMKEGEKKVILVYDLGGGTFDVTLLEVEVVAGGKGPIKKVSVITTDGNATLGGKDWDRRLMDRIIEKACNELGCSPEDITDDIESYKELVRKTEDTKKRLSSKDSAKVIVQSLNGKCSVEISRDEFHEATIDLVNTTITLTNNALDRLIEQGKRLDQILLVGGSTRMPMIEQALKANDKFKQVMQDITILVHDPDQAVAKGAALWANIMGVESEAQIGKKPKSFESGAVTRPGEIIVNEKFSKSYGIVIVDKDMSTEIISNLFFKDTSYDPKVGLSNQKQYGTVADNQESIKFRIMENQSYNQETSLEEGVEIYDFTFNLPGGAPRGTAVDVEFFFDPSSILHITVTERFKNTTNGSNQIQLEGVLSADEVDQAKNKIEALGRED